MANFIKQKQHKKCDSLGKRNLRLKQKSMTKDTIVHWKAISKETITNF